MKLLMILLMVNDFFLCGVQQREGLEVPIEALREILYNSITHKDYTGPDIQMHVYNDHVELWNEGELTEGYDEKVLYGNP